jgi:hypothetical protein
MGIPGRAGTSAPITVDDAQLPIIDLAIDGGVVVIDCRYMQFRLTLTEDVSNVVFINAAPQDTLLIELTQGPDGGHTINFGTSVVPITGEPYVATATANAVDVLGLTTNNSGVTWRMTAQQPTGSGGTTEDNAFVVILAPSPASESVAYSGVNVAPVAHIVAAPYNGVAPFTYAWSRADAGSVDFLIDDPTASTVNFTIPVGSTIYNITQQWRCTVTDNNGAVTQETMRITLARTVAGAEVSINAYTVWGNMGNADVEVNGAAALYTLRGTGVAVLSYQLESTAFGSLETYFPAGEWSTNPQQYQVRATLVSGPTPVTGGLNTWYLIAPTGSMSWQQAVYTDNASKVTQLLIEIRDKTSLTIVDSAYITLKATSGIAGAGGIS